MFLKAIYTIWYRDILNFWRDRIWSIITIVQPFFWMFVFGAGFSHIIDIQKLFQTLNPEFSKLNLGYNDFLFPGVIATTMFFSALFFGGSMVWDRAFGFLKEINVSPAPKTAVAIGKILGGTTITSLQGITILLLSPVLGARLSWGMLFTVPFLIIFGFTSTAFGMAFASRLRSTESFYAILQFFAVPLFILSGALFPISQAPRWMQLLAKTNPAAYGVDLIRNAFLISVQIHSLLAKKIFLLAGKGSGLWGNVIILLIFGAIFTYVAAQFFQKE